MTVLINATKKCLRNFLSNLMSKKIYFLKLDHILQFHGAQIKEYAGSSGIRDQGLLESALEMPQAGFGDEYFHKDIFEMAAAYLYHLVKNHPFLDGNKRVSLMTCLIFLEINGYKIKAKDKQLEKMTLDVATGKMEKNQIANLLKKLTSNR